MFAFPTFAGMIALYFQVTAPGNAARVGGEQMGFSVGKAAFTIVEVVAGGCKCSKLLRETHFYLCCYFCDSRSMGNVFQKQN